MKIIAFLLFCSSLFATSDIYAANTTLNSVYPASGGSYNKIVITPQAGANPTNVTCNAANIGLLYYSNNALQLCADVSSGGTMTPTAIPANEVCFNRFWNSGGNNPPNGCPTGYTQGGFSGVPTDHFANGGTTVYSTVCCTSATPVIPS